MHNMRLVRPALLYLNVHVLKVFYEQLNYYYYYFAASLPTCLYVTGFGKRITPALNRSGKAWVNW